LACCDLDQDGFIEMLEAGRAAGPIILPLTSPPGTAPNGFPTAPNGVINFSEIYDLNNPAIFAGVPPPPAGVSNPNSGLLFPLENRVVEIHGLTVPGGVGAGTPNEVDGTPGYKVVLPVASGEIFRTTSGANGVGVVPEPTSVSLLATGLIGVGWFLQRRKQEAPEM
jgi:hypothetical protein